MLEHCRFFPVNDPDFNPPKPMIFSYCLTRFCKVLKMLHLRTATLLWTICTRLVLLANGIRFGKNLTAVGAPRINVSLGGQCSIGDHFYIRTGIRYTEVGLAGSRILVGPQGKLRIGNHVGMSNATIIADDSVTIGDHVLIGGGVQIFDTNFHSTNPSVRTGGKETRADVKKAPVFIGNNVFIGTNAIICKGVSIGDNAIIAAGSVVAKSVPENEIWGGNPAGFLKRLSPLDQPQSHQQNETQVAD